MGNKKRLAEHRKDRTKKDDIRIAQVLCGNCGTSWAPQPWRWRNVSQIRRNGGKTIPCPGCGTKKQLRPDVVLEILRRNERVGRKAETLKED